MRPRMLAAIEAGAHMRDVRGALSRLLRDRFGIEHTTLQVEHEQGLLTIEPHA